MLKSPDEERERCVRNQWLCSLPSSTVKLLFLNHSPQTLRNVTRTHTHTHTRARATQFEKFCLTLVLAIYPITTIILKCGFTALKLFHVLYAPYFKPH